MKRNTIQFRIVLPILAIILLVSLIVYSYNLNSGFQEENLRSMEELSGQAVVSVQTEINGKMNLLRDLATVIDIDSEGRMNTYFGASVRN